MSEFRDVLQHIVSDREPGTVENCRNLRTGAAFTAEVEEIQDIELNTELGRDARESVLMHVSDRGAAAAVLRLQKVSVCLFGNWTPFEVVRRKDNPASPQVEFGLMKLTEKDS